VKVSESPIRAKGQYEDDDFDALPTDIKSGTADSVAAPANAKAKPFLKRGTRMQRSVLPSSGSRSTTPDKSASRKGLQLQPRPQPQATLPRAQPQAPKRSTEPTASKSTTGHQSMMDEDPWDCRAGNLDMDLDLDNADLADLERHLAISVGEAPTSHVVKSYFDSAASYRAEPQSDDVFEARGRYGNGVAARDAKATEPARDRYGDGVTGRDARSTAPARHERGVDAYAHSAPKPDAQSGNQAPDFLLEERLRLADLDEQVKRYEYENQKLKKLQGQVEQAERDIAREREQLLREVEAERTALNVEYDAEHAALKKERQRLNQNAERARKQLAEDREACQEKRALKERVEQLDEESREKEKRAQRTIDRLQRQVGDLTRKNAELDEELKRAGQQAQQAQSASAASGGDARRPASVGFPASARGRRSGAGSNVAPPVAPVLKGNGMQRGHSTGSLQRPATSEPLTSVHWGVPAASRAKQPDIGEGRVAADRYGRVLLSRGEAASHSYQSGNSAHGAELPKGTSKDIVDVKNIDGRTEQTFKDGRREVEFPNGLKKIIYPDGHTEVLFQNGDKKELQADGTVVYKYGATGAVQTTQPDGCELYTFVDGQSEKHWPNGSKEISFPNGTTKTVEPDGTEEVSFPDGTVRRTPSTSRLAP